MTRLHVFPKSALVPFHQLMEPNEAVGGGAAEKGGWEHCAWGAAFCAPRSGRLHTGNPGLRADKGRQGSASG